MFAGSGGVASACTSIGCVTLAVDWQYNPLKRCHAIVELDLSSQDRWDLVTDIVHGDRLVHVHAAQPCERHLKHGKAWQQSHIHVNVISSDEFPDGIP